MTSLQEGLKKIRPYLNQETEANMNATANPTATHPPAPSPAPAPDTQQENTRGSRERRQYAGMMTYKDDGAGVEMTVNLSEEERATAAANALRLQGLSITAKELENQHAAACNETEKYSQRNERAFFWTQIMHTVAIGVGVLAGGLAIRQGVKSLARVEEAAKAKVDALPPK